MWAATVSGTPKTYLSVRLVSYRHKCCFRDVDFAHFLIVNRELRNFEPPK